MRSAWFLVKTTTEKWGLPIAGGFIVLCIILSIHTQVESGVLVLGVTKERQRDYKEGDVIVHLHIPKCGGSFFGELLLKANYSHRGCFPRKNTPSLPPQESVARVVSPGSHTCPRDLSSSPYPFDQYLFSRYTVGWPCGTHAGFERLLGCTQRITQQPLKTLKFVTLLRDPVERFISEYFHTPRGWTRWNDGYSEKNSIPSDFYCNGTQRPQENGCDLWRKELPTRSISKDASLSLWDFAACPYTFLHNRQTRMLAHSMPCLQDDNDYWSDSRQQFMLQQAKETLQEIAFFGLQGRFNESIKLFEWTFGVKAQQMRHPHQTVGSSQRLAPIQLELIRSIEKYDILLYEFALHLFEKRLKQCGEYCSLR